MNYVTLTNWLKERSVSRVFIVGLATDYCVKNTALDAADHFETWVIRDAIKAVNVPEGTESTTLQEMSNHNIHFISSDQLVRP